MNSVVDTTIAASASAEAQLPSRVLEIRPEESKLVCVGADGREFALSRLVGSNVRIPLLRFRISVGTGRTIFGEWVFFANRILAFMPDRRRRTVPVPLRKLDYFEDYAILRDRHRKLEVLIEHQLLPLRWDPTWSQLRHLITATVEISADFIHAGRYRKRGGEWKLIEWETALPSRTDLEMPEGS
jgi:hypothetical protein